MVVVSREEKNCIYQFSVGHIQEVRSQCFQLARQELDMLIFGQLFAHADNSETTSTEWRHTPTRRSQMRCSYYNQGQCICMQMFLCCCCCFHTIGLK